MTDDELNKGVALDVMGWRLLERPGFCVQNVEWDSYKWPVLSAPGAGYRPCKPSFLDSDWSGVRQIVERMDELGWAFELNKNKETVAVSFYRKGDSPVLVIDNCLPRAVALAARETLKGGAE